MVSEKPDKLILSSDLSLPFEAVTETFAVLGKRGSGKTNTAVVLVEEFVAAKLPVCVVDPVGVWWGLRAGADGASEGLPVILVGGERGDVPLSEGAGRALASFVVEENAQVVLDLSLLRKGQQVRFMTDFAETLYHLKAMSRTPLHLVVDEADAFAPQRSGPEGARLLGAMEDLIRRGRSRGIGMSLITQRPAVLNKNVLTQAEALIVMKLTAPQDQNAIDDWVRANADEKQRAAVARSLPSLPIGTAWFWSPGWLDVFKKVKVRARRTFDSSATPKPGIAPIAPRELASVDLEALRRRIASSSSPSDKKGSDRSASVEAEDTLPVVVLKEEVRRLHEALRSLEKEKIDMLADALQGLRIASEALQSAAVRLGAKQPTSKAPLEELTTYQRANGRSMRDPQPSKTNTIALPLTSTATNGKSVNSELGKGDRRILTVLAQHPLGLSRIQIAILTGYAHTSGGFKNYLSALRGKGWILGGSDRMQVTKEGLSTLGTFEVLPTGQALLDYWRQNAGGRCERAILDEIASQHPRLLTKEAIANRIGYRATSGGYKNALSRLRTLQLVRGRGEIGLTETFANGIRS